MPSGQYRFHRQRPPRGMPPQTLQPSKAGKKRICTMRMTKRTLAHLSYVVYCWPEKSLWLNIRIPTYMYALSRDLRICMHCHEIYVYVCTVTRLGPSGNNKSRVGRSIYMIHLILFDRYIEHVCWIILTIAWKYQSLLINVNTQGESFWPPPPHYISANISRTMQLSYVRMSAGYI